MNVVFIIPTGIGCAIGGHAGDATPAAKMIASLCDKIILHPNVVNASDINEMPSNALYVEGSMLDRFLEGSIGLREVRSNRVLVVANGPLKPETINAVNAARSTIGMDAMLVPLQVPLKMSGWVNTNGIATGSVTGIDSLIAQVQGYSFDALAIASPIDVTPEESLKYFRGEQPVNPWGGIEALVSRKISEALCKPVAHAPIESGDTKDDSELFNILYDEVVNPRMAAEVCSNCYIHCILKGLHQAPRIGQDITFKDVDALITPTGCIGRAHNACFEAGIPVIAVEENTTAYCFHDSRIKYVENYLEAAGYLSCIKAGVSPLTVRFLGA
jgi:hypothetical protein